MKQIKEAMVNRVKLIHPQDTILDAAKVMKEFDIGMMPVVEGERVVGAITDRDVCVRGTAEGKDPTQQRVGDIMTNEVLSCYEDQSIDEVAQVMKEDKVRRVIVIDRDNKLTGVVSIGDLAGHTQVETSGEVLRQVTMPGE